MVIFDGLLERKSRLLDVMNTLNKNAAMDTWEGWAYTRTLVELVCIEKEIEKTKKEKAAH